MWVEDIKDLLVVSPKKYDSRFLYVWFVHGRLDLRLYTELIDYRNIILHELYNQVSDPSVDR